MPPRNVSSDATGPRRRRSVAEGATETSTGSGMMPPKSHPHYAQIAPATGASDMDILTGDHGLPHNEELQDFLWSMTDEPHASRRKALIKEHPELKKLMGYEWRTKYMVTALVAFQMACAIHMRDVPVFSWYFVLSAYCVGASVAQILFLAAHEISHNLAFKKFVHNKYFGLFTNIPIVVPFFIDFKVLHCEHHKSQGVVGIDTDLPTEFEARMLSSTLGKLFFMSFQMWFYALRPVLLRPQPFTKWHALNWAVQLSTLGTMTYFFGWQPLKWLALSTHLAGSIHPLASHFIAEHFTPVGFLETSSYYGVLNRITWYVGHHNEHHDFPTIPWTRLPEATEIGGYKALPHHKSWIWVLVEFLFNPKYTLYNRVKRPDKHNLAGNKEEKADYTGAWLNGTELADASE